MEQTELEMIKKLADTQHLQKAVDAELEKALKIKVTKNPI